jgi:hypothetical protein
MGDERRVELNRVFWLMSGHITVGVDVGELFFSVASTTSKSSRFVTVIRLPWHATR